MLKMLLQNNYIYITLKLELRITATRLNVLINQNIKLIKIKNKKNK